jgi:hypothetical protein
MELSRGRGESAMKSERVGKAWAAKRARIAERKLTAKSAFANGVTQPISLVAAGST